MTYTVLIVNNDYTRFIYYNSLKPKKTENQLTSIRISHVACTGDVRYRRRSLSHDIIGTRGWQSISWYQFINIIPTVDPQLQSCESPWWYQVVSFLLSTSCQSKSISRRQLRSHLNGRSHIYFPVTSSVVMVIMWRAACLLCLSSRCAHRSHAGGHRVVLL